MESQFVVADQREAHYSKFPHYLLNGKASHSAMAVYAALDSFLNRKTGQLNPSLETLAKRAGCSRGKLPKYIKELEQLGCVTVKRQRHTGNNYALVDPSWALTHPLEQINAPTGALVSAPTGATNYMNLNSDERTHLLTTPASQPASRPSEGKRIPTPTAQLVIDWYDTARGNHFRRYPDMPLDDPCHRDTTRGEIVNNVMALCVRTYGAEMAQKIFGQYWIWWEARPEVKGGRDIYDFRKKIPMLRDIILERTRGDMHARERTQDRRENNGRLRD